MKIINFGVDWLSDVYHSPDLRDKEKRKAFVQNLIAYIDPTLKLTSKQNVFSSDFRFATINSRYFMLQYRGWEFSNFSAGVLKRRELIHKKIINTFKRNNLEITNNGTSRIDFQISFVADRAFVENYLKLDSCSGDYKEFFKLKDGTKHFNGYTLYASKYMIRLYNKSEEVKSDSKKIEWIKTFNLAENEILWRFEIQINEKCESHKNLILNFLDSPIYTEGDSFMYFELTKSMFEKFNIRLKLSVINQLLNTPIFQPQTEYKDAA